jgi:hypothetical protein
MKVTLLALAAVICGGIAGYVTNQAEFGGVIETHFDPKAMSVDSSNATAKGPRVVVVNGESHNFGTMEQNTRGTHVFKMQNVGDAPLQIEKGDTTCKCTVSEMENGSLAPGETVDITLSWEVIDPPAGADFRQVARFRTNDPQRPLIELLIHGFVSRSIRAAPEELIVKRISANEAYSANFNLFAYQHSDLEVTGHEFQREETRDYFEATFRPLTANELQAEPRAMSGVLVSLRIQPGLPIGTLDQTMHIETNLPDNSNIDVPIRGTVTSDISVVGRNFKASRNLLDLRTIRQSEGATANLHILVKGPDRENIQLEIESTDPSDVLQASIGEADRSNPKIVRYPLTIEIPPGAREVSHLSYQPDRAGKVLIKTTHPQAKEIQVLVRFAVEG